MDSKIMPSKDRSAHLDSDDFPLGSATNQQSEGHCNFSTFRDDGVRGNDLNHSPSEEEIYMPTTARKAVSKINRGPAIQKTIVQAERGDQRNFDISQDQMARAKVILEKQVAYLKRVGRYTQE